MNLHEIDQLVKTTSDAAFALDSSGCIGAWNGAAEAMFGLFARDAIGRRCDEVVQGTDESGPVCSADCSILRALRNHEAVGNFDLQVRTASGVQWCNVSVVATDGEDSASMYSIHVVHTIDAGRRLESLVRGFVESGTMMLAEQTRSSANSTGAPARKVELSARELDVLTLLAKGARTTAVAAQLHVSPTTVRNHVQHILHKLDSHTRLDAVRRAKDKGLI